MTPDQISLVQTSFARLAPQADGFAESFYDRLFQIDPALGRLFPEDLSGQREKLMRMIAAAVRGLGDLTALVPEVVALGRRHAGYGAQAQHYAIVGQALIETLRSSLGADFTRSMEQAWTAVYTVLSDAMQAGAMRASTEATPSVA